MKNIPRIFVGDDVTENSVIPAPADVAHYLNNVMRRRDCLVFGGGREYCAQLSDDKKHLVIGAQTAHRDPSGDVTLFFAPIKRTDDLINMATQMGVAAFQPVITNRTTAHHINWTRMEKIAREAAEQSNRNSVPKIFPEIKLADIDLHGMVFADERAAYGADLPATPKSDRVLIGPEGGFSDDEFSRLDAAGARGISLGKTILRAELAAAIALAQVTE